MSIRNILHLNMSICLLFAQLLYLFGINWMQYKVKLYFRNISTDFFLNLVRLSNNSYSASLFSSFDTFMDVCRWNGINNCIKICLEN